MGAQEVLMPGVVPSELWIESKDGKNTGQSFLELKTDTQEPFAWVPLTRK